MLGGDKQQQRVIGGEEGRVFFAFLSAQLVGLLAVRGRETEPKVAPNNFKTGPVVVYN